MRISPSSVVSEECWQTVLWGRPTLELPNVGYLLEDTSYLFPKKKFYALCERGTLTKTLVLYTSMSATWHKAVVFFRRGTVRLMSAVIASTDNI